MIKLAHLFNYLGTRLQNCGYLVANPDYAKVRRRDGDCELYRLLNKSWFPRQEIQSVLDVGANEGQFIKTALVLMPNVFIYAFEPNPEIVRKLEMVNWDSEKVRVIPIACGSKKSAMPLYVSTFSPASSFLGMGRRCIEEFPGTEIGKVIEVDVDRLDNIVRSSLNSQGPYLLKIDVQGLEMDVLEGAIGLLQEISVVVLEAIFAPLYESQCSFESILSFMRAYNYELIDIGDPKRSNKTHELLYRFSL